MKRITESFLGILLSLGMLPLSPAMVLAEADVETVVEVGDDEISEGDIIPESDEVVVEEQDVLSTSDMLHFVMDVRWGNVRGDVETREEANFDGSVSVPVTSNVSLRQLLRFERHDELLGKENPVSWESLIYGHWDGVRVLVSAQAGDLVTITTTQGSYSASAQTIFAADGPIIEDLGSGREIVVRARPLERRSFFFAVGWGHLERHTDAATAASVDVEVDGQVNAVLAVEGDEAARAQLRQKIEARLLELRDTRFRGTNFSGSATVSGGTKMKAVRPLRFERIQGDKIHQSDRTSVEWRSSIFGGLDGVLLRLHPDRTRSVDDKLTIRFPELDFSMDFPIVDLIHNDTTTVEVPVANRDGKYQLIIKRWRHPHRSLIRARNSAKVYVVDGDLRRHVVSTDAFARSGLRWEDVEVVDEEDADTYVDGEPFGYEDGEIIKGSGPEVFVITDGKRRHVKDPGAFARLGYDWKNLIVIPDADVMQYEVDEDTLDEGAQAPEGALLRVEGDPKVYRIEGGRRKHVPNPDVFSAHRLRWEHVQIVGSDVVSELPVGDDLNYPDGSVVAAPDGKVYEISEGKRHHIRSAKELLMRGHRWENLHRDNTGVLVDDFEEGEPVELLDDVETL